MCFDVKGFKKKTIVLLIIAALGNGALIVCSDRSTAGEKASENAASESNLSLSDLKTENDDLFGHGAGFPERSGYLSGNGEFFFRAILSVLFVVVLGVAAVYVSKKLLPQLARVPGKEIRIVETVHLGPRKALHLIQIDNRRFLIGSSNENITKLAEMTDSFAEISSQEVI